ncbi:MAG: sigma 54-interacting transcriptional regulator [Vicinamibacteria bacterium]|nr:sigma 54-interacting transcriptional regulator [Vicinamibacteria bacterium]
MLLSLNPSFIPAQSIDPVLHGLRSLVARGRHAEADRLAQAQKRRLFAGHGRLFLALRAEIALGLGRFGAALNWATDAMKRLDATDDLAPAIEASKIRALLGLGRFREAQVIVESSFASRDRGGSDWSVFRGQVALHAGRLLDASAAADDACVRAQAAGQRGRLVESLLLRARTARETGDPTGARRDLDRALGLSQGRRDASALAAVLSDRADLMAHSGDWVEAARDAGQSARLFARTRSPHEHLSAGRRRGLLGLALGDPHDALPSIERAAEVARRGFGATDCRAEIELLLADARLAGKDAEGALDRATAALSYFRDSKDPGGRARSHVRRSVAALSAANMTLAFREARMAVSIKDAGPVAVGLAELALGWLLLRSDPAAATDPFERASRNRALYPPLQSVARLGAALSSGASPQSDTVSRCQEFLEAFGDRRILAMVRADMKETFGVEPAAISACQLIASDSLQGDADDEGDSDYEFLPGLVGASESVRRLSEQIRRAAPSDLPVSIYGETGTGKEKIARAVHHFSSRATRGFVPFNSASVSDELFESQLFGHVRGSFTGAHTDSPGLVEKARGGTLFIDEIADLSLRAQVGLLRVIQEGTYRRVGEAQERRADVRFVVASNQPLENLVAQGSFRKDLFQRIRGVCVTVPPLRDRGKDIVHLARHFVGQASGGTKRLSGQSEANLPQHDWPGNVRELEMDMRRSVVFADSPLIEWRKPKKESPVAATVPDPAGEGAPMSLHEALCGFERTFLRAALSRCAGRVGAASRLGISRQALHQKIVRYGL